MHDFSYLDRWLRGMAYEKIIVNLYQRDIINIKKSEFQGIIIITIKCHDEWREGSGPVTARQPAL